MLFIGRKRIIGRFFLDSWDEPYIKRTTYSDLLMLRRRTVAESRYEGPKAKKEVAFAGFNGARFLWSRRACPVVSGTGFNNPEIGRAEGPRARKSAPRSP